MRALCVFHPRYQGTPPKSEPRAYIASVRTSLIVTCIYAGVNVLDYLVALQEHRAEVFADPEAWLPWTYCTSRASP